MVNQSTDSHAISISNSTVQGQVGQTLTNCTSIINAQPKGEKKALLEALQKDVRALIERLPEEKKLEVADDLKMVVDQATAETPNRKWYSVSSQGLLEAAKWAGDFTTSITGTVGRLTKLVIP